jgi:SHS2 domain-containing protein
MWFPEYPTWLARFNDREEICNRSLHTIVIIYVDRIEISNNYPEPASSLPCPQTTTVIIRPTMYETFEHTADLGLRVAATDLEGLFTEAARGLLSIFVDNPAAVRPQQEVEIRLAGKQYDYLLFDWLSELIYRFETEHLLLCEFQVTVSKSGLSAIARGEPADPQRHQLAHEVKAITYHQLVVEPTNNGWRAELIVDI